MDDTTSTWRTTVTADVLKDIQEAKERIMRDVGIGCRHLNVVRSGHFGICAGCGAPMSIFPDYAAPTPVYDPPEKD